MLLCIRSVASLTAIARDAEIFLAALERLRRPRVLSEHLHQSAPASKRLLTADEANGGARTPRRFCWRDAEQSGRASHRCRARNSEDVDPRTLRGRHVCSSGSTDFARRGSLSSDRATSIGGTHRNASPLHRPWTRSSPAVRDDLAWRRSPSLSRLIRSNVARRFHVRGADLLRRLLGLCLLRTSYDLLGEIALAGPGRPRLEVWEQPYRRQFRLPHREAPHSPRDPRLRRAGLG